MFRHRRRHQVARAGQHPLEAALKHEQKARRWLPRLNPSTMVNDSPHVVILGAGASEATMRHGNPSAQPIPVMNELVNHLELPEELPAEWRKLLGANFESAYADLAADAGFHLAAASIRQQLRGYFERLRLPERVTLYDELVVSLRPKDLIATFNWDPLLLQAIHRNCLSSPPPQVVFLHGNVGIGACLQDRQLGTRGVLCPGCRKPLEPVELLYPVRHKDYDSAPVIKNEWSKFRETLSRAYMVTVFGYSAPVTDAVARDAMLGTWRTNGTRELAQIEIIDIRPARQVQKTWRDLVVRNHSVVWRRLSSSHILRFPRRSCDAFAMASLQCAPWYDNPLPRFRQLDQLHRWLEPLLEEEARGQFSGQPHRRRG